MAQVSVIGDSNVHYGKTILPSSFDNDLKGKGQEATKRISSLNNNKSILCVLVLFSINLLNYMDRLTIAAVLTQIQLHFSINDQWAGLLQTVFIVFFMIFAPVCGFLGDRYNRKMIMIVGLIVWILAVLASSFIPSDKFYLFMLLRGIVGIGEASYSTIAPSIIADIFVSTLRSRILMFFYFAIPVGSGLGYIAGSFAASAFGSWEWGVRVTPPVGLFLVFALIFFVDEPERGLAEREHQAAQSLQNNNKINTGSLVGANHNENKSPYIEDLKYLLTKKSYLWSVVGYVTILFVIGTLTWWAPSAVSHATAMKEGLSNTSLLDPSEKTQIFVIFGGITGFSGLFGVSLGVIISQMWKDGKFCFGGCRAQSADALVSAIGSLFGAPLLVAGYYFIDKMITLSWITFFFAILLLCLNWAIVVDMLMYIIVPNRRNVANSWMILLSHMFGDASGPYIVGLISDTIRGDDDTSYGHYFSLIYAFYSVVGLLVISGLSFLMAARYLPADIRAFESEMGRGNLVVYKKVDDKEQF